MAEALGTTLGRRETSCRSNQAGWVLKGDEWGHFRERRERVLD